MYSLKAIWDKQPVTISTAAIAVLNVLVAMSVIQLDAKELSAINVAAVAVLGLFINSKTANKAGLDEVADVAAPPERDTITATRKR